MIGVKVLSLDYRNYLKERPGLNERPLRMTTPLHNWKIQLTPRLKWVPLIQIVCKNDKTRVFFSQVFFVFYNKEIYKHIL